MRIAVASCGLGHVARGIETWAEDLASALGRRGEDVTLFAGSRSEGRRKTEEKGWKVEGGGGRSEGVDRSTFNAQRPTRKEEDAAGRRLHGTSCPGIRRVDLGCLRRTGRPAKALAQVMPGFSWRWGMKSAYGWEQLSFWLRLWPHLRRGRFDILHVQDPMLAFWCRRFRRAGWLTTKEILAHGTEEPIEFVRQFEYVQHLAPWHLETAEPGRPTWGQRCGRGEEPRIDTDGHGWGGAGKTDDGGRRASVGERRAGGEMQEPDGEECRTSPSSIVNRRSTSPFWVAIPNFVDTEMFRPVRDGVERAACRRDFGVPGDALVVGTAAAVKKDHKRIDYLIWEFAAFLRRVASGGRKDPMPFLAIAGARQPDSEELVGLARDLAGDRAMIRLDLPRADMPEFYRCLDVFVLPSLFEMLPIAVLEALASGLPVIGHGFPVLRWMLGDTERGASADELDCGAAVAMDEEGALAKCLGGLAPDWIERKGCGARRRAETAFSTEIVVKEYVSYYARVAGDTPARKGHPLAAVL